jgi:hypothetical protein
VDLDGPHLLEKVVLSNVRGEGAEERGALRDVTVSFYSGETEVYRWE